VLENPNRLLLGDSKFPRPRQYQGGILSSTNGRRHCRGAREYNTEETRANESQISRGPVQSLFDRRRRAPRRARVGGGRQQGSL